MFQKIKEHRERPKGKGCKMVSGTGEEDCGVPVSQRQGKGGMEQVRKEELQQSHERRGRQGPRRHRNREERTGRKKSKAEKTSKLFRC